MTKPNKWSILIGIFGASYGVLWTILETSSYFGLEYLKNVGIVGHVVLVSIAINITLIIAYLKGYLAPGSDYLIHRPLYSGEKLAKTLAEQFKKMLESQDYQTILRIGIPLSRALWLEGQYKTRVVVGRTVEEAAARLDNPEAQACALIDDVGWTMVALGELVIAENSILRGIDIATTHNLKYLASKGYRHLAGLEIQQKRGNQALTRLKQAAGIAIEIQEPKQKDEMLAGIYYGAAEAYLMLDHLNNAEDANSKARDLFIASRDKSRAVKTFAQLGKIREKQGKELEARDCYRKGLSMAEHIDRRDEIIRNYLGLARIALSQGNHSEAQQHLKVAREMQKTTPLVFELDSIEDQIRDVERRQNNES